MISDYLRPEVVKLAEDLLDGLNESKSVMTLAEMFLMSRCQEIYGPVSAFSKLPAKLANLTVRDPLDSYESKGIVELLETDLTKAGLQLDRFHRAYAWYKLAYRGWGQIRWQHLDWVLSMAEENDPVNRLFRLKRVINAVNNNAYAHAEFLLATQLEGDLANDTRPDRSNFLKLLGAVRRGNLVFRSYYESFCSKYSKLERPWDYPFFSYVCVYARFVSGETDGIVRPLEELRRRESESSRVQAYIEMLLSRLAKKSELQSVAASDA